MQKVNPGFLQLAEVMHRPSTMLLIDQQGSFHTLISVILSVWVVQYGILLLFAANHVTSFMKLQSQTINFNVWI